MKASLVRVSLITGILVGGTSILVGAIAGCDIAKAQIQPDGTLNTTITQNGNNFAITNGSVAGSNLFHSFQQFSVPTGGSATFDLVKTPNVSRIFSRVTGGSISQIDGLIRALNNRSPVSLYLLNPRGIILGPNARLEIGGSFVATTANSILFADGFQFNTQGTPSSLLTISVPVGLQLGPTAGAIQVQGPPASNQVHGPSTSNFFFGSQNSSGSNFTSGLQQLTPGQTLALVGSQIDMTGARLFTLDGHIELWAVRDAEIAMNSQERWQLAPSSTVPEWGTISLKQASFVDASGRDGGSIQIRGRGLTLQDGSNINANTLSGRGKGVWVKTTEFIDLLGISGPLQGFAPGIGTSVGDFLSTGSKTDGRAGDVVIETNRLRVANSAWIQSATRGNGSKTGDITIRATDVDVVGYDPFTRFAVSAIANLVFAGRGESGRISIEAQRMRLIDGARISADLLGGEGKAGDISIRVAEGFEIRGASPLGATSAVLSAVNLGTQGQGGNIEIVAGNLHLSKGGTIASLLTGTGRAGSINIRANSVDMNDLAIDTFANTLSGITVGIGSEGRGTGGSINLETDRLRVSNGGQIASSSLGQGPAGSINVRADRIEVQGRSELLRDGRQLPSSITASSTTPFAAGSVNLTANTLRVQDGAEITVSNVGSGDAGNLNIKASQVLLDTGAKLRAEVNGGSQGNIEIRDSDLLVLRHGSNITTDAQGASTGGNITIDADTIAALPKDNSDIVANAVLGSGGNIQIVTQSLLGLKNSERLTPESDITASSQFGVSGTVQINTINLNPSSGLVALPINALDPSQQIATGCAASGNSHFAVTGRGGIPSNPTQQLMHDRTWDDLRDLSVYRQTPVIPSPSAQNPESLIEATDWQQNSEGKLELIATHPPARWQPLITRWQPLINCAGTPRRPIQE